MTSSTITSPACPRCSSPLVEIHLDQAGRTMIMRSCSTCDTRSWQRDGEDVAFHSVLDTVATTRRLSARATMAGAGAR